ncbi:zinc transporter ZupT [Alloprevotella sp. OH1205_COT-284]|uniref:zinc transporter ZupT n=1 Tax=Alloprevotella sp. OH1205_COT-284 TaxID=2491043 RepID=UPI000F5D506A|nr:zinc transporter ZupT [Alloprevotella sp. OH1205_COT-284]RRD79877.1 zinc transporter ZupT [Alloprevotella sp. OH1205_COT-284]
MSHDVLIAFLLTLSAGFSTGIGSAIAFFAKRTNTTFLAVSLGFSAGVMIYVSFVELFASSVDSLTALHGRSNGTLYAVLSFFGGIFLTLLIDQLVPDYGNPHEIHGVEEMEGVVRPKSNLRPDLMRVGLTTALVLGIHNFPEGMVTFLAGLQDVSIAVPIALAIALHNIPEGISVSVPIYYATGSRKRAFWLSFLSGLAEPFGAIIGYLVLAPYLNDNVFGIIFGVIAGIMVFISLDELLPSAEKYGKHHQAVFGLTAGMAVMAFSLLLLG